MTPLRPRCYGWLNWRYLGRTAYIDPPARHPGISRGPFITLETHQRHRKAQPVKGYSVGVRAVSVALIAASFAGCADVISVKEKKDGSAVSTEIDGLPFYIKTEQFKKVTVYSDTWLRAALKVEKRLANTRNGQEVLVPSGEQLYTRDLPVPSDKKLDAIRTAILEGDSGDISVAKKIIAEFEALPAADPNGPHSTTVLKNAIETEWVVDNSRTYFLNAPLPWFGSGNLSQELNSDGTLGKASSNPDQKIAEGISSLIPLKEYLTGRFVKSAPAAAATDASTKNTLDSALRESRLINPKATLAEQLFVYVLTLKIDEIGYEYTLTTPPQNSRPSDLKPIPFSSIASNQVMFSRKPIGAPKDDEKDKTPKIEVSGTITLPKEEKGSKN